MGERVPDGELCGRGAPRIFFLQKGISISKMETKHPINYCEAHLLPSFQKLRFVPYLRVMNAFFDICCGSGEEQFHTNGFSVVSHPVF